MNSARRHDNATALATRPSALFILLFCTALFGASGASAQTQDGEVPPSTPGLAEVCKVMPDFKQVEAGGRFPEYGCKWFARDGSPSFAQLHTLGQGKSANSTGAIAYAQWKQAQEQWSHRYDGVAGMQRSVVHNTLNCTESTVLVWSQQGKPIDAVVTARCDDLVFNFRTSGLAMTQGLDDALKKIVIALRTRR